MSDSSTDWWRTGLIGGLGDAVYPTAVPDGAQYDVDTVRSSRFALLGGIGGNLLAAAQRGLSPGERARLLGQAAAAPAQAQQILLQGGRQALDRRLREAQIRRLDTENARETGWNALFSSGGAGSGAEAGSAPTAAPAAPAATAAPRAGGGMDLSGYQPPEGVDRDTDLAVRTVLGEAGDQGPVGQSAVAHVIRNRVQQSGQTPAQVVLAPSQFEPWNTPAGRQRLLSIDPQSPEYQNALRVVQTAFASDSQDPTQGATHFFSPGAQAALQRQPPSWAAGQTPLVIGGHNFYRLSYRPPGGAQAGPAPIPPPPSASPEVQASNRAALSPPQAVLMSGGVPPAAPAAGTVQRPADVPPGDVYVNMDPAQGPVGVSDPRAGGAVTPVSASPTAAPPASAPAPSAPVRTATPAPALNQSQATLMAAPAPAARPTTSVRDFVRSLPPAQQQVLQAMGPERGQAALMQLMQRPETTWGIHTIEGQVMAVDQRNPQNRIALGRAGDADQYQDETRTIEGRQVPGQVNRRTGQFTPYSRSAITDPSGGGPLAGNSEFAQANNILLRLAPHIRDGSASTEDRALYARMYSVALDNAPPQWTSDPSDPTGSRQIMVRIPRGLGDLPAPTGAAAPAPAAPQSGGDPALTLPTQASDGAPAAAGGAPVPVPGAERMTPPPSGFRRRADGREGVEPIPGGPADDSRRPLTEAQGRSNMFGQAMEAADRTLRDVPVPSSTLLFAWRNAPETLVNMALSADDQRYFNALRSFAAGILRKETGAAFTNNELLDVQSRFFPLPGDSDQVREQKAAARRQAIESMRAEVPGGFRGADATAEPERGGQQRPRVIEYDGQGRRVR